MFPVGPKIHAPNHLPVPYEKIITAAEGGRTGPHQKIVLPGRQDILYAKIAKTTKPYGGDAVWPRPALKGPGESQSRPELFGHLAM